MPTTADGGLGLALVGEKIVINSRHVSVAKLLGEGGFSYVYLVKEISDIATGGSLNNTVHGAEAAQRSGSGGSTGRSGSGSGATGADGKSAHRQNSLSNGAGQSLQQQQQQQQPSKARQGSLGKEQTDRKEMVLKVTSILSRQQRDIAEKEAKLLSRLSHPSIIKMYDTCYRTVPMASTGGAFRKHIADDASKQKERPQHLILMEFCEGGHALDVCSRMAASSERFDLSTLIIAFGQICNAVSYLHAQRPPIVHRDLKPANFLVKNGAYKLCDFGSAVFGHVDLKTSQARVEAEEVIQKTTTQMFRAPEMVDLYMAKKLTQATDVWALGCCLYSMAFLQNCFEEGSNLAILSRKYKIPDDNPYGDGLVELIDRMLTVDSKARSDMTEVILCLSAVYSGRPLPPRKDRPKKEKKDKPEESSKEGKPKRDKPRVGAFRTDGQGLYQEDGVEPPKKPKEAKKLDPNSAAARRRMAAGGADLEEFASFHSKFDEVAAQQSTGEVNEELAFSTTSNPFAAFDTKGNASSAFSSQELDTADIFASFSAEADNQSIDSDVVNAFNQSQNWGAVPSASGTDFGFSSSAKHQPNLDTVEDVTESDYVDGEGGGDTSHRRRAVPSTRRPRRRDSRGNLSLTREEAADVADVMRDMSTNDDDDVLDQAGSDDGGRGDRSRRPGTSGRRPSGRKSDPNITPIVRRRSTSRGDGIKRTSSSSKPHPVRSSRTSKQDDDDDDADDSDEE